MSDLTFETLLTGQLREYAEAGVRPIDRFAIAEGTIAAGRDRQGLRVPHLQLGRRPLVLILVGLLVIALAAGTVLVGGFLRQAPTLPRSGYDAIVLRPISDEPGADLDVIVIEPDGRERIAMRLTAASLPDGRTFLGNGLASQDGWLALGTSLTPGSDITAGGNWAWALVEVADPDRSPILVPADHGGAWSGGHRFATAVGDINTIRVVDPVSETSTTFVAPGLPGGGPSIVMTEDGSGVLVGGPPYAIKPIDGGPVIPDVPWLAPYAGSRYWAAGGSSLSIQWTEAPEYRGGSVSKLDAAGTSTIWYRDQLAPARLFDASFSEDGRSIWLLLDRVDGERHIADIARLDAPEEVRVIGSVDLGEGVAHLSFDDFAPDDSAVAIGYLTGTLEGQTTPGPTTVMWLPDATTSALAGHLVGFVPAAVAEAWPTRGAFPP